MFYSLDVVVHFYAEREIDPAKWYPRLADGQVDRYDDLPPQYENNVDVVDAPFDRKPGDRPALDDAEMPT